MAAGDRFKGWIEGLSVAWGDRLRGWMMSWFSGGVTKFIESIEPLGLDFVDESLAEIAANPLVPAPLRKMIGKIRGGGHPLPLLLVIPLAVILFLPIINNLFAPVGRLIEQQIDQHVRSFRFDPGSVIAAWRRDPAKYADLLGDLRDAGWSPDRIEALKFITQVIPQAPDIIRFALREVYTPEIAEKYGQFEDIPTDAYVDAEKAGLPRDTFDKFWAAHWYLPSSGEGFEMLHRGVITEDELRALLKANDIMPYWREKLMDISWHVPTRVDVRRFWDMRTIDEARLREIYTALGYHGKDLDDYVLWTKIYVDFPTLLARWKNGWISLEEVKDQIIKLGMPADRAEELLQEKIQAEGAERTSADRALTLTDIYKGVKQERITRAEAVGLIMDLGYDEAEAGFKLDVNVPSDEVVSAVQQRQLAKADILAGLKTGILTDEGARQMLLQLRYAAADVEFLVKLYHAQMAPPVEPRLKEASKADILLGVKRGLITPEEGYGMLLDIDYSPEAADFILMVKAEESPFSPVSFDEFKDRTQKWRLAAGMEGKPMTEEIKKLGADVVRLSAEVAALTASIKAEEGKLVPDEVKPAESLARVKKLQATLHKAQAELARVQTDYRAKIAEWRHGS